MSKRKLFLASIVIILTALLVAQVGRSMTAAGATASEVSPADSPHLEVNPATATTSMDIPGASEFPSPQPQLGTSPYAKEGLKISGGGGSMQLPK
ncbi:MAG: hypothetical protein PVF47_06355 [Anaerolineae bacterium]|jgi:hypothetical protein